MKNLSVFILLLAFIAVHAQRIIYPGYDPTPTITFSETLSTPVVTGTPLCGQAVGLSLTGCNISGIHVSGDSLILDAEGTLPGPVPLDLTFPIFDAQYDTVFVFDKAGSYQAYLNVIDNMAQLGVIGPFPIDPQTLLGSFRIYPILSTLPVYPVADDSITLKLIVGQTVNWACPPSYTGVSAVVDSTCIRLSYTEHPNMTLMACLDTIKYGPLFSLHKLAAGSYSVYIEDSVFVGSIVVTNPLIVNGRVTEMIDPRLDYIRLSVLKGAAVIAVAAPACTWGMDPLPAETLRTVSDSLGQFSLTLPDNHTDFLVMVSLAGYQGQRVYTNTYESTKSLPPVKSLSFELIEDSLLAENDLEVRVTNSGAPMESVYVSLSPGREVAICPMYDIMAKAQADTGLGRITHYSGTTGSDGKALFSALSLNPFIDYVYNAYYYGSGNYLTQRGVVRLNRFIKPQTLEIALVPVAIEQKKDAVAAEGLTVLPNPFNPSTEIRFSNPSRNASITLYDLKGQRIAGFKDLTGNSVTWNATHRPSGLYIVKAVVGSKRFVKRVLLQK
ncbi:MAG: T9SS type A sorting domain-containing protein [Fibrobacterota bacterium]